MKHLLGHMAVGLFWGKVATVSPLALMVFLGEIGLAPALADTPPPPPMPSPAPVLQEAAALPQGSPNVPVTLPLPDGAATTGMVQSSPVPVQWGNSVTAQTLPAPSPLPASIPPLQEETWTAPPAQPPVAIPVVPASPPPVPLPLAPGPAVPIVVPTPAPAIAQPTIPTTALTQPSLTLQGVAIYEADEFSARARVSGLYPLSPRVVVGGTVDVIAGEEDITALGDEGVDINELYVAVAPESLPSLRFIVGQVDLTSYFDRNSFAKDGATQFFNDIFQTNPALAAANIGSRPGVVVNWSLNDNIEARVAGFSSSESIGDFQLDGFAGELGFRVGNAILRGTYVSSRDTDLSDAFDSDRLESYGVNAEVFVPDLNLGLFARYGQLVSRGEDFEVDTYSLGLSVLDLFMQDDRLGLAYGRNLSDVASRNANDPVPDALELFYDFPVLPNLRLGFTLQQIDDFSDTIAGVRVRTDFDLTPRER